MKNHDKEFSESRRYEYEQMAILIQKQRADAGFKFFVYFLIAAALTSILFLGMLEWSLYGGRP